MVTLQYLEVLEVGIFRVDVEFDSAHRHVLCWCLILAQGLELLDGRNYVRKTLS